MIYNVCYAVATTQAVVPLAYSAEESVLIARCTYSDVFTQLVAIGDRLRHDVGYVGNEIVGVGSISVQFVKDSGMLVVVYAERTDFEGTAACAFVSAYQLGH